jgi:hypothetical protein
VSIPATAHRRFTSAHDRLDGLSDRDVDVLVVSSGTGKKTT